MGHDPHLQEQKSALQKDLPVDLSQKAKKFLMAKLVRNGDGQIEHGGSFQGKSVLNIVFWFVFMMISKFGFVASGSSSPKRGRPSTTHGLAIAQTDLVLTVPRTLAKMTKRITSLRMIEPPRELKPFPYFMSWHPRLTNESAQAWLRDQVRAAARSLSTFTRRGWTRPFASLVLFTHLLLMGYVWWFTGGHSEWCRTAVS
jgi:hypothetical protein